MDKSERDSRRPVVVVLATFSCFSLLLLTFSMPFSSFIHCYILNSVLSLYRASLEMASDDAKPSFTLTYNKPTAKKIEYEDEDDYIDQETGGGGFGFEQGTMKKKTALAAANGRVAPPCCQVENCGVDLINERYYRRHKVCQVHAKAPVVIVAGAQQRFCQQCSRFHELTEFDKAKRSCRRRLAGHNERRRKCSSETQEEASSFRGPSLKLKEIQHKQANERGSALPGKPSSYKHFRIR